MITFSLVFQYVGYALGRLVRGRRPLGYWSWFYDWPEPWANYPVGGWVDEDENLDWNQGDLGGEYWDDGDDEDEELG